MSDNTKKEQPVRSLWTIERESKQELESRKRESILEAAAIAFVRYGYHRATMDKIAELLDVSKPTLYRYFKNKTELLEACHNKAINRFIPLAEEAKSMEGTAIDKVKHYLYGSAKFYNDEYGRALSLVETNALNPKGQKKWREHRDIITDIFRKIIEKGISSGEINKNADAKLSLLALFGAFNAIATWYHTDGEYTIEEVCDRYFEVFINGLKT